jgi:putative endonuclease
MYFAYVIRSLKDGSFYKGHCQNLEIRLQQHNSGKTRSIRTKTPFVLVYFEEFATREEAIIREKYFKSGAGRRFLSTKVS